MRLRLRRLHRQQPELDITAFMNLMVILVPFLLITAVFNQVNILEMNLPAQKSESTPPDEELPPLQLEVILRSDQLLVGDKPGRVLKAFPKKEGQHDLAGLSEFLKQIKARFPEETAVTLLMEPETPYESLVSVMDTVRVYDTKRGDREIQAELFPDIALGDAPLVAGNP